MPEADLVIAGVGGQGTLLAGKIIAEAALAENHDVKSSETHGMAQRGGSVLIHVRFARKVYAPLVPRGEADFLLAFEQLEALRSLPWLAPEGTAVVNMQAIAPLPVLTGQCDYPDGIEAALTANVKRVITVNALSIEPVCAHPRTANLFLLGILARRLPFPRETWDQAIARLIPPPHLQINSRAFETGWSYQVPPEL